MTFPVKVALIGATSIVAFDAAASLAARQLGFPYAWASVGSYLLLFTIGRFAARSAPTSPIAAAALAAAFGGLADASLGWAVSWMIGPGRLPSSISLSISGWIATAIFVVGVAAAVGAIGGAIRRRAASVAPAA
ncbi:MAG TPA: hypothetical protein VH539_19255 [Gemmatimonadaceae bacterium]|jgi:hypothetical protein